MKAIQLLLQMQVQNHWHLSFPKFKCLSGAGYCLWPHKSCLNKDFLENCVWVVEGLATMRQVGLMEQQE